MLSRTGLATAARSSPLAAVVPSLRAPTIHIARRTLTTRPHPLASRVTPKGPVPAGKTPPHLRARPQRLSLLSAILLATLTGSLTYALGRQGAASKAGPAREYKEPTLDGFTKALDEIKAWLDEDDLDTSRDTLVSHGYNEWGASRSASPFAVVSSRSRADPPAPRAQLHTVRLACPARSCTLARPRTSSRSSRRRPSTRSRSSPTAPARRSRATRRRSGTPTTRARRTLRTSSLETAMSRSTTSCQASRSCSTLRRT